MVKFSTVEEVGFVKSIEGAFATVEVPKKSACEGCSLKICKPEQQFMELQALNSVHARVGQKVKVVLKSYTYLKSSMVVYGIPALALVGGAVIGKELFGQFFTGFDPDMVSAVSGFCAFMLSFLLIKLWSFSAGKKAEAKPVIEEILTE
jgi:sigma-E factor negative regulatory protein RseC